MLGELFDLPLNVLLDLSARKPDNWTVWDSGKVRLEQRKNYADKTNTAFIY